MKANLRIPLALLFLTAVFGHGGAHATNMTIDSNRGLITVFMVQHSGFAKNGGNSRSVFQKAALERFGKGRN